MYRFPIWRSQPCRDYPEAALVILLVLDGSIKDIERHRWRNVSIICDRYLYLISKRLVVIETHELTRRNLCRSKRLVPIEVRKLMIANDEPTG